MRFVSYNTCVKYKTNRIRSLCWQHAIQVHHNATNATIFAATVVLAEATQLSFAADGFDTLCIREIENVGKEMLAGWWHCHMLFWKPCSVKHSNGTVKAWKSINLITVFNVLKLHLDYEVHHSKRLRIKFDHPVIFNVHQNYKTWAINLSINQWINQSINQCILVPTNIQSCLLAHGEKQITTLK